MSELPFAFAKRHGVLKQPPAEDANGLLLQVREPLGLSLLAELRRHLGQPFEQQVLGEEAFAQALRLHYQQGDSEAEQVAEDIGADEDLSQLAEEIPESADLAESVDDAPVIRLINAILSQAVREKASDIHVEPFEDRLAVRFRIDGVLREVLSPKRQLGPLLVSRLKVMARLDIAEKRIPQDGRISVRLAGHGVDIRVSTIPSAHGERVVLRLLDKQAGQLRLAQLALPAAMEAAWTRALQAPHGIILVTGPTGSGKTTTLYAGLSHINDRSRNILTIEDPVEYLLPGIGQTQVNSKVDMSFARGLRAILRQDPDVVMVGEIRDSETAEIAVQASLTGHLVLSTLHTNTAIGAITRLKDMGIEPFLLASSVTALMAQRLVRLLCTHCREAYTPSPQQWQLLGLAAAPTQPFYRAIGCEQCGHSGYRGRTGIYELILVDDQLRRLIHDDAGELALLAHVRQQWPAIESDGQRRVLAGETTLEEVIRVTAGH